MLFFAILDFSWIGFFPMFLVLCPQTICTLKLHASPSSGEWMLQGEIGNLPELAMGRLSFSLQHPSPTGGGACPPAPALGDSLGWYIETCFGLMVAVVRVALVGDVVSPDGLMALC